MTHTQVDLQHCGDLDLQHNGVDEGDLDQNVDIFSSLQHLVDVMEARIKQVSKIFKINLLDPISKIFAHSA